MPDKAQDDDLVMSLVDLALARPEDEREAYLRSACEQNPELFAEVWKYVQWDRRMKGFLLDPVCPPLDERHFEPGELLDGRFRIVREVAQGGMGVVYEACDEKLDRRIAIKCAKAGFHKRLPPEARNAREIAHPNVCKIFEIHTAATPDGDVDFLAMEFLEGETLAERLRRGRVPESEARAIARQLCAGLAEAHRNQVIHGDLKSNNVILTKGTDGTIRAVITDFGLARRPESSQWSAHSTEAGGTPDYMAPELWKGDKPTVFSDIYALGVILYELASGRRPYGAESWEDRLTCKPEAANAKWDRVLARCLDPDAARRFRSAEEVAEALAPRTRRWLLGAAAALVLAALSGLVTYQTTVVPRESVRLALEPSGAEGLARDLAVQLNRIGSSARTKFSYVPAPGNATHVLRVALSQERNRLLVHAFLTDARAQVNAKEWNAAYADGELRYAPVALAGMVTSALHLPPLDAAPTVNQAAKHDYEAGLAYLQRYDGVDAALPLLERAVEADPGSPLTHAGLAHAEWLMYALTKDQAWLDRTTNSVRLAESRNLDVAAVHDVAGLLKANAGFYEQAAAEYRRALELDPQNGDAYRRLGAAYQANNQLDDALVALKKAVEVQPDYFKPYQSLGAFYSRRGDYQESLKAYQRMVNLAPDLADAHFALATAYNKLGRAAEAESELRTSIRLQDTAQANHDLGYILMHRGRDREAISFYQRALALGPETTLCWLNLGVSYSHASRKSEAQAAFSRGLTLAEKEVSRDPRNGGARAEMAYAYARLGDARRAESEAAQALRFSPEDKDTRWMAAVTLEALGMRESSLAVLSGSPGAMLPGLLAELSRYPDVADLSRDPRFLQLQASFPVH